MPAGAVAERLVAGLVLATIVVGAARRARSLGTGGAVAAVLVGAACAAAGWGWAALLGAFFAASSALSRWRGDAKARRTDGIVAKGGERDARQVLANGGPFAAAALLSLAAPGAAPWLAAGAGALAAATADTWGTEVGTAVGGTPRLLTTLRPVAAGTSGGVTPAGTAAGVAGAAFIAACALLAGWGAAAAWAAVAGGVAGTLADSLLGATVQARRRCERCGASTERRVHSCGGATAHAGGVRALDNDAVNLLGGLAGLGVGLVVGRMVLA